MRTYNVNIANYSFLEVDQGNASILSNVTGSQVSNNRNHFE